MTKSIHVFGKDKLEVDISSWSGKYSITLNNKEIFTGKITARQVFHRDAGYTHEIKIGDKVFQVRFVADIFGIMNSVVKPITDVQLITKTDVPMSGTFLGKEIESSDDIKKILVTDEKILCGFQQAGLGGKIAGLESIFVTNKRIIKISPKTLGLRSVVTDYLYKDMANVKLDKGILRSSITVIMRFQSETASIDNIPKDGADKIFKIIQDGITGKLETSVSTVKIDVIDQIKKLKELKDNGIINEDEFNTKKKDLLSRI